MILFKKAIRAMWDNKAAYFACIALISLGICLYLAYGISANSLQTSKDEYYWDYKMADVFATVQSIPVSAENSLRKLEGIRDVNLRLVYDVPVNQSEDEGETDSDISLRLVSIDLQNDNRINDVVVSGQGLENSNDIWLSPAFIEARELQIGDTIHIIVNGREIPLNIAGAADSPEYVYTIKSAKDLFPDPRNFSVAYMDVDNLARILDKADIYNDVTFLLEAGWEYEDVSVALEDALSPYGLMSLFPVKDQLSNVMLQSELDSINSMVTTIPAVFIGMAMVILYLMLKRVIEQDRMQIGTLKAFGYSNAKVLTHYLSYGIITGFFGSLLGIALGLLLAEYMTDLYTQFFALPAIESMYPLNIVANSLALGILGGAFGALMGAGKIITLIPAEAMRPVAPAAVSKDPFRFFPYLRQLFNSGGSMAIRSIARSKLRSFFIVLSIAFSFSLLAFMNSYNSMFDDMLMVQYTKVQHFDFKIDLEMMSREATALHGVSQIDSVSEVEGLLALPLTMKHHNWQEGVNVVGMDAGSTLYRIYDSDAKAYLAVPEDGIIISSSLAKALHADKGDVIYVSSPLFDQDEKVIIADVVTQHMGHAAFAEKGRLQELFRLSDAITSLVVKTSDPAHVKNTLKYAENIAFMEDIKVTEQKNRDMMESYSAIMKIMDLIAIGIAFAIIYNTSSISLSERQREYATLRVLGMHVKEVARIMAFEYWLLLFLGMIAGIPLTSLLKNLVAQMIASDMFSFPTYTPISAYVAGAVGTILAVWISNVVAKRNIQKFDMIEVLKERE